MKDGQVTNLKQISSAVIRISREQKGIGAAVVPRLFRGEHFASTLLLSPPGGGKTTLLRDLVRLMSRGEQVPPQRIALIDERDEIAVMYRGQPQMDVGPRTDILNGCPKAAAIPMVLRAMNPQIIALDEITVQEDLQAIAQAAGCGVGLLATIHAGSVEELQAKPLYRALLEGRVFRQAVLIRRGSAAGPMQWRICHDKACGEHLCFCGGGLCLVSAAPGAAGARTNFIGPDSGLAEMETAIRLERTSLPMLLTRLAEGREPKNAALFLAAAMSLRAGTPCLTAWRQAAEDPAAAGGGQASAFPSGRGVDRR